MATSKAATVAEYLTELPADRRMVVSKVRQVIRNNLPRGYEEKMNWGGICYQVPLKTYPKTYNGQPLAFAGLAAQKNYFAIYLMCAYSDATRVKEAFKKAGKKLDMGKCCIRFKKLDDIPLEAIGKIIAGVPVKKFIESDEAARMRGKC